MLDVYKNKMFQDHQLFENKMGAKIKDFGYTFTDWVDKNDARINLLTGPVKKGEAINKFFDSRIEYEEKFKKDVAIYYQIDYAKVKKLDGDFNELKKKSLENVDCIQKYFNGFLEYLYDKDEDDKTNSNKK